MASQEFKTTNLNTTALNGIAVDSSTENSLTDKVLCNNISRTVAPVLGALGGAIGGAAISSPSLVGTPIGAFAGAGLGAEATAASLRAYCDKASLPDALACNGFARATLPAIGAISGVAFGAATGLPTAVGTIPAGAIGGAAGVATVEVPLQAFCDGQIDGKTVAIKSVAGAVGGVAAGVVTGPAQVVGASVSRATGSFTTGRVAENAAIGATALAAQNTTQQSMEIASGRRNSFDLEELGAMTGLGVVTGGTIGYALGRADIRMANAEDAAFRSYSSDLAARAKADASWHLPRGANVNTPKLGGLETGRWLTESDAVQLGAAEKWASSQFKTFPLGSIERHAAGDFSDALATAASHLKAGSASRVMVEPNSLRVTVEWADGRLATFWPRTTVD